ncbi:hypothetical protein AMECASPLE_039448 [Ameca splendens]|uniref:Uncharacterized protein n=1 Tax=Ameca splendens TaxID=208324 RepID=A0ABV0ZII6_9TELE
MLLLLCTFRCFFQEAEFLVFSVRQLKEADARSGQALETLEILIRRRKDEFLVPLTSCVSFVSLLFSSG